MSKLHPWIYVIIPVEIGGDIEQQFTYSTQALFTAFCKDCRSYYSETIPYKTDGTGTLSNSGLPREGCGEEVAAEGFSSLPGIDR